MSILSTSRPKAGGNPVLESFALKTDTETVKKPGLFSKISGAAILCICFGFSIWSWTEDEIRFYLQQSQGQLERFAQVKFRRNEVTRNNTGQLLWQQLEPGEIIYLGNSIQTGKNSSTEIILDSGEQIHIGPDALIRFVKADDKISLELIDGQIEVKAATSKTQAALGLKVPKGTALKAITPSGAVELQNTNLKITAVKNKTEKFKIEPVTLQELMEKEKEAEVEPPLATMPVLTAEPLPTPAATTTGPETTATSQPAVAPLPASPDELHLAENVTEPVPEPKAEPVRKPARAPLRTPQVKHLKIEEVE